MSKIIWNPDYIKGKVYLPPAPPTYVLHDHAGGYYSDGCSGCIKEKAEMPIAIDVNKLKSSYSSSAENDKTAPTDKKAQLAKEEEDGDES